MPQRPDQYDDQSLDALDELFFGKSGFEQQECIWNYDKLNLVIIYLVNGTELPFVTEIPFVTEDQYEEIPYDTWLKLDEVSALTIWGESEFEQQECIRTERGEWAAWKTWSACDAECVPWMNMYQRIDFTFTDES